MAIVVGATQASAAFELMSDGHRIVAADNALVVGGVVYPITTNPQTAQERELYVQWLEVQVFELQRELNAIPEPNCEVIEGSQASAVSQKIAALTALLGNLVR